MIRIAQTVTFALLAGCVAPSDSGQTQDNLGTVVYGVDYAWARPSLAALHADGFRFAARYLSYDTSGKNLSQAEADALQQAGLDVVVVWEQNAGDALAGYARGASDAQVAAQQAAAFGAPATRPIYFAVDFDATPGQQGAIDSYFDGVASVIGHERTGAYGGYYPITRLFDAGKIAFGWQTYAWSGGQWDSRAQLRQVENGIFGGQLDRDEAVANDYGQWGAADTGPAPAHPPVPTSCGAIDPGHGLSRGQSWGSCDDRFSLAMQTDGNLVLYSDGVALWATGTNGRGGDVVVMQTDGNFVLYSEHSRPLFASGSNGHGGARLAIQDDGNVVVYQGSDALWSTQTAGMPPAPTGCGAIGVDRGLAVGEAIASCDGQHVLVLQGDGNLVLYHGGTATWASNTDGRPARRAVMQGDGNFVVYGTTGALWSSHTYNHGGASLAIQDDGNLVIYRGANAIWASGTDGQ